ncbi:MAG: low molecular weight protein-tyrosine-phosphatase [Ilumatobacteraceae bacterium]
MTFTISTVCLGNICRSPMAEAIIRSRVDDAGLGDRVVVNSAGTDGWHIGEDADPRALATLRAAGYDLHHSGRQFQSTWHDPEHPDYGDLVLAMDAANYAVLLELADGPVEHRVRMMRSFDPALAGIPDGDPRLDVPDPWFGDIDGFSDVLHMLESAADGLVTQLPNLITPRT